jgi:hypothetical protein
MEELRKYLVMTWFIIISMLIYQGTIKVIEFHNIETENLKKEVLLNSVIRLTKFIEITYKDIDKNEIVQNFHNIYGEENILYKEYNVKAGKVVVMKSQINEKSNIEIKIEVLKHLSDLNHISFFIDIKEEKINKETNLKEDEEVDQKEEDIIFNMEKILKKLIVKDMYVNFEQYKVNFKANFENKTSGKPVIENNLNPNNDGFIMISRKKHKI